MLKNSRGGHVKIDKNVLSLCMSSQYGGMKGPPQAEIFEDLSAVLYEFLNRKCIPGSPKSQNFQPAAGFEFN